ncbi:DUF899 domain-containing protein [Amycolatopsis balhimycina DSM 5908]|uniref:DUF899 domain-containing protein n=1 Tax=Amycolatopsis balhimycina DSM 5908 TaxID=1081091 RepID=A0A428W797_AMYBA|nr:DUF899 family protein [Amycolatopsis balhimycina]RSM38814.1 DUF899 domain-containing protein [Amycolatopsis balhimycina DSM 5908]
MTELALPGPTRPALSRPRPVPAGAYRFVGPAGPVTLAGLFEGRQRLVVHHTVPDRSRPSAVASAEELSAALHTRDTRLVIVSHAPYAKIEQYRKHFGWDLPVYSALDTGFAADFPATRRLEGAGLGEHDDGPGLSFLRQDGRSVLHTGSIAVPYLDFLALADVARAPRRG